MTHCVYVIGQDPLDKEYGQAYAPDTIRRTVAREFQLWDGV